uniref:Zinc finger piccolo-type domain-containing protein n=1 Tax=Stegastes partitus TaxID=144197 RepID=A0A3B5ANW5_9TELE
MQPAKDTKPTTVPKSEQDKKQQQPQQAKAQPAGQGKPALQKTSSPGSPQKKVSTPAAQPAKAEAPDSHKQVSPAPGQTKPQETQKAESGVTGKMFGFGSSIFSSASTLITSAVQDESKITPPVSPKMSPAKSPSVKKQEQEKKPAQPQQAKGSPSVPPKTDKPPSEPLRKASASTVVSKTGQSTCPLCKLELNVGSKDPPNYNTCTECKNTVCNQCGFNSMPNVKEWLCLNCQMQRALGASEPPGTPMMKLQASPNKVPAPTSAPKKDAPPLETPQKKDIPASAESKIKEASPSGSPIRKPQKPAEQPAKTEAVKGPESQKQASPAPGQKTPQQGQKTGPQKPPDQTKPNQTGVKKSSITSTTQEESGGFFGFGGPKTPPTAAKSADSVTGKMFGFGSSIFSSASTLINSAVQDESKTTPPVSPKMPVAKATKSPPVQKPEHEKKQEQVQQPKTSPSPQAKVEKGPSQPQKDAAASPAVSKAGQSACPLCKVELNFGSKEPPNYNKCTECQNTVCNQCGFNPMPNVSEVITAKITQFSNLL